MAKYTKRQVEEALGFWMKEREKIQAEGETGKTEEKVDEGIREAEADEGPVTVTVGQLIKLLEKSDPSSELLIRLNPGKEELFVFDVSQKLFSGGPGVTYVELAKSRK